MSTGNHQLVINAVSKYYAMQQEAKVKPEEFR
jgi:hypothetical protein